MQDRITTLSDQKNQLQNRCHSEERSDVGISWYGVGIRTIFQEIATPSARNDGYFRSWSFCFC